MRTYREISLGHEAITYIREYLKDGKTLAAYLLQRSDLEKGRVITALPSNISDDDAEQFREGKLKEPSPETYKHFTTKYGTKWRMVPKPNMDFWLVSVIQEFLTGGKRRYCIFENALAEPTDPWILNSKTQILIFKNELYHFLSESDSESKKIENTIRRINSWLFICAMTSSPKENGFYLKHRGNIILEQLKILAERTAKIVVSAYDGEGYIIWNRK